MTREEAYRQVSGPPVSDSRDRKGDGGAFYQYCRQHGEWPKAVSTWDPRSDAAKFAPYMPVRNVTADYPATMLIHGTADTDVPYEQSVMMAAEFKKHGVEHELISIPGGEHGLGGGDPKLIDAAYASALEFLKAKLAL
jgi:dipeptidyl aminopeptidase/acylaminoacyl peptidase